MLCVKYMFGFLLNLHEYNLKNEKKKKIKCTVTTMDYCGHIDD